MRSKLMIFLISFLVCSLYGMQDSKELLQSYITLNNKKIEKLKDEKEQLLSEISTEANSFEKEKKYLRIQYIDIEIPKLREESQGYQQKIANNISSKDSDEFELLQKLRQKIQQSSKQIMLDYENLKKLDKTSEYYVSLRATIIKRENDHEKLQDKIDILEKNIKPVDVDTVIPEKQIEEQCLIQVPQKPKRPSPSITASSDLVQLLKKLEGALQNLTFQLRETIEI